MSFFCEKICLGTIWGQQNTEEEGIAQLDVAFDKYGINFLDTAEMYPIPTKAQTQGQTDRIIGKWLKGRKRGNIIIASKVCGRSPQRTWMPGRNGRGTTLAYDEIMISVDESLKRLGTSYIDLLQIHWPDRYVPLFGASPYDISMERDDVVPFEEQLRAMQDLVKAGKIRYFGVSNETPFGVMKFSQLASGLS